MNNEGKIFKDNLELLKQFCDDGQLHYSIWKNMNVSIGNQTIYYDIEVFLGMTLNAHFEASVSRLYRLLDIDRDTVNICYLLNFIEQNPCVLKYIDKDKLVKELKSDRDLLKSKEEVISNLKTLRDKYYAHLDKKHSVSYDKLFKENLITYNDMDEMFNLIEGILIKYENYFHNYPEALNEDQGRDDVKLVMQIFKEYMINKK